MAKNLWQFIR